MIGRYFKIFAADRVPGAYRNGTQGHRQVEEVFARDADEAKSKAKASFQRRNMPYDLSTLRVE